MFKLTGVREVKRNIERISNSYPDRIESALEDEAGLLLESSQAVVPVESGALKESGQISKLERVGNIISVEVTYGNSEVDYAAAVHENMGFNQGGKYLEQPLRQMKREFPDRLASKLKVG